MREGRVVVLCLPVYVYVCYFASDYIPDLYVQSEAVYSFL